MSSTGRKKQKRKRIGVKRDLAGWGLLNQKGGAQGPKGGKKHYSRKGVKIPPEE